MGMKVRELCGIGSRYRRNTPTQDAYGQPVEGWTTVATVWAAVDMLTGRELFTAQQAQSEATVRMTDTAAGCGRQTEGQLGQPNIWGGERDPRPHE
jgi:hypothetical protein